MSGTQQPAPGKTGLSMVVTCYNQERYIRACLESTFAQDYDGPMELIVVDDCSTDRSAEEIARAVQDFGAGWQVRIIRNEQNLGVSGATDAGWAAAQYEWFVMVDGDDVQFPDRCSKTADIIRRHPEVDMIALSAQDMSMDGTPLSSYRSYSRQAYAKLPEELLLATSEELSDNFFGARKTPTMALYGCGMAVSRRLFERWGLLQPDGVRAGFQDRIWEWRAFLSSPVLGSKQLACYYRCHDGNLFNRTARPGLSGFAEHETYLCRRFEGERVSQQSLVRDMLRALRQPGLSIWNEAQLKRAEQEMTRRLEEYKLKGNWWLIPWTERVKRVMNCRHYRSWSWPRLLPLAAFSLLARCTGRRFD